MTEEGPWTFRAPSFFISSLLNSTSVGCIMVTSYCSSKNIQVRKGQFFCTHFACHIHSKKATSHTYKHEWMSYRHTHFEIWIIWILSKLTMWGYRNQLNTQTITVYSYCTCNYQVLVVWSLAPFAGDGYLKNWTFQYVLYSTCELWCKFQIL